MGSKLPEGVQRRDLLMIPVDMIEIRDEENYTRSERGDLTALAKSIASEGMQNPVRCYRNGDGGYVLRSGYRRMRAVEMINTGEVETEAEIERVPVIIEDRYANEADRAIRQILENAHREDASFMERAKAYRSLQDVHGLEIGEIASRLGEKPENIRRYMTLLGASQPIRKALEQKVIAPTAAASIVRKNPDDPEGQKKALDLAITASGGKRATTKGTTAATRVRKPRQRTRTVVEVKEAITSIESEVHQATIDRNKAKEKRLEDMIGVLKWVLGDDSKPW